MKLSALLYLACPNCQSELVVRSEDIAKADRPSQTEIYTGELRCLGCDLSYPITHGVPRFVRSEWSGTTDINTGKRFGDSWKRFSRLHDRYTRQFFDWMAPVTSDFVTGKVVLDAGCGKGRHTAVLSQCGAKAVIGVDIGSAIDVAYANTGRLPNVHLIQADLKNLPLKPVFDWICSTGVLHHMQYPESGFRSLSTKLNPTGALSVWVYGRENNGWLVNFINPVREQITCRMPGWALHVVSFALAIVVFFLSRFVYAPWSGLQNKYSWLPSLFYQSYLSYISSFDIQEIDHIVFDHLTAPVAHYLRRQAVESWYRSGNFGKFVIRFHNRNSWSAFGTVEKDCALLAGVSSDSAGAFDRSPQGRNFG